jgi:UDP-N-acetylmuramyl pentapeptide phosphotransferase/UDP-N-acetylglucosamine-1-phosphate transferase
MFESLRWWAIASAALAFLLVGLVRRVALHHGVLDHPTHRSSHVVATPRGGGLGLLLAALGLWGWQAIRASAALPIALLVGAAIVATVGWIDDRRGLGVRIRLAAHGIAALAVGVGAANGIGPMPVAIAVFAWWTLWTVSSINLVNFMDGINGLVASQIAVFAVSLALFPAPSDAVPYYAIVVAAACIGFLPWNFPHARIFLGDVGSGGLGFLVPALALLALQSHDVDFVRAHLPLIPLYSDATLTILRRWRNGERLTDAHRTHLYQRLANGGMGHTAVTLMYTCAAIFGALAAHLGHASWLSPWTLGYVTAVIAVGLLLHRRAVRQGAATA